MNEIASCKPTPWYHWHRFAVLPNVRIRKADRQNTASYNLHWLVFRAWTMDSPDLGAEVTLGDQDLQIRVRFPYLITGLFIPLFPYRWAHKLWRKPNRLLEET